MKYVGLALGWIAALLFALVAISMLMMGNWLHALVLLLLVLLCLPPATAFLYNRFALSLRPLVRTLLIGVLVAAFVWLLIGRGATSIYASPEVQARMIDIYDAKMTEWPVPYEDVMLETQYGLVHVIVSGPEDAPPLLLLHASGVAGWSWKYNVDALSEHYRTYAIDLIGDVGKSEYASLDHVMKTVQDQVALYTEITDKLGIEKAYVVGASEGGFIGSNYALYAPERVEKLALLGPMGYSGAVESILRISVAQFFPLKPIQTNTFRWAFSDSDALMEDFGEWFRLFMSEVTPIKVPPLPLPAADRQQITVPVLFVFGSRDNLVGDPVAAEALVQDMPDVRVEIVEAGHLMGAEIPDQINELLLAFFAAESD